MQLVSTFADVYFKDVSTLYDNSMCVCVSSGG